MILKIFCTYDVRGLDAGDKHDQQLDGDGDEFDRRPLPLQGHHVRVWGGERRGYRVHEGQAGHQQPSGPVRRYFRNGPTRVHRHVRARRRQGSLDLPHQRHWH